MHELPDGERGGVWSRYLRDRESIWKVFRDFRDRRDVVTLRFESVDTAYTARVRDVDHRRVTLEGIHPRSGEVLMNSGRGFAVAGRSDGAYVYAPRNQSVGSFAAADGNAFMIDLPGELLWQQRRRAPRFPLPPSLRNGRTRIVLQAGRRECTGSLEDISVAGCRAVFGADVADLVAGADTFDDVAIEIAGLVSVRVRVAVRHRVTDSKTGAVTCGLEFVRVPAEDRARLEQFLRSLAKRAANG
jgi:c-di-GMP-binding flagellar brake protein YcgR